MKKIKKSNVVFGVIILITLSVLIIFSFKRHWSIAPLLFPILAGLPFMSKIRPGKKLVSFLKKITDYTLIFILLIGLWGIGIHIICSVLFTLSFTILTLIITLAIGLLLYLYLALVLIPILLMLTGNESFYEK